jgi:hypothetical protein
MEGLAVRSSAPTPDAFFEHVRYSNPFSANRVVPSTIVTESADQVHRAAFNRLTELAFQVVRQQQAVGVLLWGEAGVGKSHLLARLANWAGHDDKQAVYVYLANLQAQPEHMPRSLLRCVVSILTRGRTHDFATTPLYRIVRRAVKQALHDEGGEHSMASAEAAFFGLTDELCATVPAAAASVDRPTYALLFRFFRSVYTAGAGYDDRVAILVVRWLAGDPLEPEEARSLGLPRPAGDDETVAIADDEQIKRILIAFARLAALWERPLILCLDQVDNLEREQFAALSRFLQALLDGATNLLVITAGVRETIVRWENDGVFTKAAWDRLAHYLVELQRIGVREARQVIQSRLQPFQEPFLMLPEIKELVQRDYLFPLGETWAQSQFGDKVEIRPRDVINWAAAEWRRQQDRLQELGGPNWLARWSSSPQPPPPPPPPPPEVVSELIDGKVALKLREHISQRQLERQTLPPDADNLAGLIHSLLKQCLNAREYPELLKVDRQQKPKYGPRPPFDLILRRRSSTGDAETTSGVACMVVDNRTSMSAYLRRLVQDPRPPHRAFLVTEERRPLDPGAAGMQYLEQVRQRYGDRFRHVELTFDRYAELDALAGVIGLARSGDLEIEPTGGNARRVSEAEVIESYCRKGHIVAHPLLRQLLTDLAAAPGSAPQRPAVVANSEAISDDRELREFIMGRIAMTMGCSSRELAVQFQEYLRLRQGQTPDEQECRMKLEEAARQLHQEGKLNASPHDDYLYLLNR